MVIGLNLCPFARKVFEEDKIRYVVTDVTQKSSLLEVLSLELTSLAAIPRWETVFVIHPEIFQNFIEYSSFLPIVDQKIKDLGLRGTIQIASFHPQYQFGGSENDAAENYTNRSPFPMLHLLREESISKVAADPHELLAIPQRNIERLRDLGVERIKQMLR